jgi:hypothetical protein
MLVSAVHMVLQQACEARLRAATTAATTDATAADHTAPA